MFDALNEVAPLRLEELLRDSGCSSKSAAIPARRRSKGGGYKLVYTDAPNIFTDPWSLDGGLNALGSLGIHVTADGMVDNAWPDRPGFTAGISNGMKIVAVNGRRFSGDEFTRALAASKDLDGAARVHRRERQLLQAR